MVHEGHINETKILGLPTEGEWRQVTSEDHNLRYIKRILSGMVEKRHITQIIEKQWAFQTISAWTSGFRKWVYILL